MDKFDPLTHGIHHWFVVRGHGPTGGARLETRGWNRAVEAVEHVGTCRNCGHPLLGLPTERVSERLTWYSAQCTQCDRVVASPNGEVLVRSGRWSEQPAGFMAGRRMSAGF